MSKINKGPNKGIMNAVNLIRSNSSNAFKDAVPIVSGATLIDTIANPILEYTAFKNEFINGLINRIALTKISNKVFNNPLSRFKKGSIPLGTDIQDIYTNPAKAEQYEVNDSEMAKLLSVTEPDTKVAYYRRNRKEVYPVTVSDQDLQGAFVSWEALEKLVSSITNSLYSGNYIDEFRLTKQLIAKVSTDNKINKILIDPVTDETTGKAVVKQLRTLYSNFSMPSTKYNSYKLFDTTSSTPVETWTEKESLCLIIRSDMLANIDVDVLAAAFNIDKAQFLGSIIVVDEFDNAPNLQCVLCDEAYLQIYDNNFKFTEFYNARTLTTNFYLHTWNTFSVSPFANAVALELKPVTP